MHSSHLNYLPIPWPLFAFLVAVLVILAILIQVGIFRYVYMRLGLSPGIALVLLIASLLGSYVNLPVAHLPDQQVVIGREFEYFGVQYIAPEVVDWPGTVIAINMGGAVIPIALSLYLWAKNRLWGEGILATAAVSVVCNLIASPVEGLGIEIPIFIPPITAVLVSLLISRRKAAPLAYISGSLGTLIGADLLNLPQIQQLRAPLASIGGAGTFDAIFLTGMLSVLLASLVGGGDEDKALPQKT